MHARLHAHAMEKHGMRMCITNSMSTIEKRPTELFQDAAADTYCRTAFVSITLEFIYGKVTPHAVRASLWPLNILN